MLAPEPVESMFHGPGQSQKRLADNPVISQLTTRQRDPFGPSAISCPYRPDDYVYHVGRWQVGGLGACPSGAFWPDELALEIVWGA
jgi:hypothetical protein